MAVVYGIDTDKPISPEDRKILRDLAKRAAEIASSQQMKDRISLWKKHNSLSPVRPMILVFPEGGWKEILPDSCKCSRKDLVPLEWSFQSQIYEYEHFQGDNVIDPVIHVQKVIHDSGWGIKAQWQHSHEDRGARTFKPVIHEPSDLKKIQKPAITYDEKAAQKLLPYRRNYWAT
ncbi:MAG: hypothetical protein HZA50_14875 [Planctomycetes bacterium]|nr:hypothetical protein [Planctomycetota bacterium]